MNCKQLNSEIEDYKPEIYYCMKNIWFPAKKQTCKKQEQYNKPLQRSGKARLLN